MFATDIYGTPASPQPNPQAAALGVPARGPEVAIHTPELGGSSHRLLQNPTIVLVALLGLAALLVNFSVRFEVSG